ncbi:MAG: hypothetical protein ABFS09_13545 [Thermodesulfobacteriota bacterium]
MSSDSIKHIFLVQAQGQEQARRKVLNFLEHTELIRYDAVTIHDDSIISGADTSFWNQINQGVATNRKFAEGLIVELEDTGVSRLAELKDLAQGYPSKVLHTLVHILDGFIGVDSAFYNLLEDSHWLSASLRETIQKTPEKYWLVPVLAGRLKYSVFHAMDS